MSRYYFHVRDGESFIDLQGTELPDLAAARREAVRFASSLLADKPDKFWDSSEWTLRVADQTDLTLFELTFFATESPAIPRVDAPPETGDA